MKDFLLIFWDATDKFQFEKIFSTAAYCSDFQSNIWYIEYLNQWITTDKSHSLHIWDLEQEIKIRSVVFPKVEGALIEVIALEILNVLAISSTDKQITMWEPNRDQVVLSIKFEMGGIHSMVYSDIYQIFFTSGYDDKISMWSIHPVYYDNHLTTKLVGHTSMVTAIQIIEKTPMLVSSDDSGHIRIWDIRNFNCIQTLEFGSKLIITKLVDLFRYGKLAFVGARVSFIDFDVYNIDSILKGDDQLWPIKVDFNQNGGEILICTRKDIRFIDIETGRTKRIYVGLLKNEESEIVACKIFQQNNRFLLGDHRGNIGMYNYNTGELIQNLESHTNEIESLRIDYSNKLIISGGWDSSLIIQKETKKGFEVRRKITNMHYNKEILFLDVSVYHNLIVTCSSNNVMFIWDYEYAKLLASITIDKDSEPSCLKFINGYAVLIVGDNQGKIHFFHFKRKTFQYITIQRIAIIDINSPIIPFKYHNHDKNENNAIFDQIEIIKEESQKTVFQPFSAKKILLEPSLSKRHSLLIEHEKISIQAARRQSLLENVKMGTDIPIERRISTMTVGTRKNTETLKTKEGVEMTELFTDHQVHNENKVFDFVTNLLLDIPYNNNEISKASSESKLYIAVQKGIVQCYDISKIYELEEVTMIAHANTRSNYNCDRLAFEDFETSINNLKITTFNINETMQMTNTNGFIKISNNLMDLRPQLKFEFQAHKDSLTTLNFMITTDKKLMTSSIDNHLKIWDLKGNLLASLNINHPLPTKWSLDTSKKASYNKKISYALQLIEASLKRHKNRLTVDNECKININYFLEQIEKSDHIINTKRPIISKLGSRNASLNIAIPTLDLRPIKEDANKKKVTLMKDEYSPRDLQFEKTKNIYQKELQGPSLRQMDNVKKVILAQKSWREATKRDDPRETQKNPLESKAKDDELLIEFLYGDKPIFRESNEHELISARTRELGKKLDTYVQSTHKKQPLGSERKPTINLKKIFSRSQQIREFSRKFNEKSIEKIDISIIEDEKFRRKAESQEGKKEVKLLVNLPETEEFVPMQYQNSTRTAQKFYSTPTKTGFVAKSNRTVSTAAFSVKASSRRSLDFFDYANNKLNLPALDCLFTKTFTGRSVTPGVSTTRLSTRQLLKTQHAGFHKILLNLDCIKKKHSKAISSVDVSKAEILASNRKLNSEYRPGTGRIELFGEQRVVKRADKIGYDKDRVIVRSRENAVSCNTVVSDNYQGLKETKQGFNLEEARLIKQKVREFKHDMLDAMEKLQDGEGAEDAEGNQLKEDLDCVQINKKNSSKFYLSTDQKLFAPFAEIFDNSNKTSNGWNMKSIQKSDKKISISRTELIGEDLN